MKLSKDIGFYLPSFFMLQINEKEDSPRILTHELIHFLQDISTTYGLINISRTIDEIKELNRLYLSGTEKNNILFEQSDEYKINRDIALTVKGIHNGMYKKFDTNTEVISLNCVETRKIKNDVLYEDIPLYEVSVEVEDTQNNYKDTFVIGAMAIMESMAHIIENHLYGEKQNTKTFPYDIVSMIIEYKYPKLSSSVLAIAELCEASLMYYDPAKILYESLNSMKLEQFQHSSQGDTYRYIIEKYVFDDSGTEVNALTHFFEYPLVTAINQVNDLITISPYKEEKLASSWISNAKELRTDSKKNITALCYDGREKLFQTLEAIGLPLVIDNGEARATTSHMDKKSLFLYPVMSTFLNCLLNKETKASCELNTYCANNTSIMNYDDSCSSNPWSKIATNKKMCAFLDVKKMWGFEGKPII